MISLFLNNLLVSQMPLTENSHRQIHVRLINNENNKLVVALALLQKSCNTPYPHHLILTVLM